MYVLRHSTFANATVGVAAIDKKLLIFLYKYLEPGDDEATVRRKFDAHWHENVVE